MDSKRIQRLHKFMHDFKKFLRDNKYDIEEKDIQWYLRGLVQFSVNEFKERTMDYEQLYKEALERAEDFYYNKGLTLEQYEMLETIFPNINISKVLKDIKIKQRILFSLQKDLLAAKNSGCNTKDLEDCVAWFKQCIQEGDKIVTNEDGTHFNVSQLERVAKKEPKFEIGDYLVTDYCRGKVIALTDYAYLLDTEQRIPFSCEHNIHLWTIQDAKDGDVLACENGWTCIFNCLNDNLFSSHCFMDSEGWFCEDGGQGHTLDKRICGEIHPATKKQCDLLFRNMKEAGYTFDFEKKELKKIESKPSWSEEDEENSYYLKMLLENLAKDNKYEFRVISDDDRDKYTAWLKSLKDRVQLQNIAYYNPYKEIVESIDEMCKQLKNLKG